MGGIESPAQASAVDQVLAGLEFDDLPAVEKAEAVSLMSVFARVEPSHKSRLVELLKAQVSPSCMLMPVSTVLIGSCPKLGSPLFRLSPHAHSALCRAQGMYTCSGGPHKTTHPLPFC